jgi:tetratricopeptide (TPR) repeat protein
MLRSPRLTLSLLALTFFLGTRNSAAQAADEWPVPRGPSREPVPYHFDPGQVKDLPRDFLDDAAACVLYSCNTYLVEADGTIEAITHEVTRLNGRKGVEKLGEYKNIVYDPSFQQLTLNVARVHKAGGKTLDVEPRHVQLRDVSTDYQVYDHEKQLIISFPSLEVGDTIEVKWTLRGKNPEHDGHFFTRYTFGDATYPVAIDEIRVRLPKGKPFKYATVGGRLEPFRSEDAGQVTYHWKAVNCSRPPQDENAPSREELRLSLACSTFGTWATVGKWKQKLRSDCWACTPEVQQVVAEVTKGLTDPAAKARALTYWMRRNIRYVSAGERHDYTPHPPAVVLANRYGDCKDTSQLLAVMLREAGLDVALATLGVQDDGQVLEEVPSPWGTHAILLVRIRGKNHWIDTTASLAGWDFLPREDRDRLCYVVDPSGRLRLVKTPPLTPEGNRIEQTTRLSIGADGSTRAERVVVSHGSAALGQRDLFVEVPAGERRRQAASELQDANSRTRLLRLNVEEKSLMDFDQPVTARLVFETPGQFTGNPELEGSLTDSKVWGRLLSYTLDYDRQVGLQLSQPFESVHRYVIQLPPAYYLETLPKNRSVQSRWGSFTAKVSTPDKGDAVRRLEVEFHTRIDKYRIDPADFDEFRKFQEDIGRDYRVWLTLKPARDLADAPLLEAVLALAPEDSASAAVLARLYLQHHQAKDARRVLQRARAYGDDAELWELSVKAAAGPEEEEKAYRELIRRTPEEPRHAVALGANLVGRDQHDEARLLLQPLTQTAPPVFQAQAHYQLARSYYRKDDLPKALQHLTDAAGADPEGVNTVRAHCLKGHILEEMGKPAEATKAYQQALVVDHDSDEALKALVRLALAANRTAEALDYLRRFTVVVADDADGQLQAADFYLSLQRYDDAFDLASRVREKKFHEKSQRILGLVYLHRGDYARAAQHLDKASPDAVVLGGLIRSSVALGSLKDLPARLEEAEKIASPPADLKEACATGRRLLQRRGDLARQLPAPPGRERDWATALDSLVCAEQLYADGRRTTAVEGLLHNALAQGLEVGPAIGLRGRLALEKGKLSRALADGERAIVLSPGQAIGYYVRGRVLLERGGIGALDDLGKAVQLSGRRDADLLHAWADALYRAGHVEEALKAQREAVKLNPKDLEMAEQLATFEKDSRSKGAGGNGGVK